MICFYCLKWFFLVILYYCFKYHNRLFYYASDCMFGDSACFVKYLLEWHLIPMIFRLELCGIRFYSFSPISELFCLFLNFFFKVSILFKTRLYILFLWFYEFVFETFIVILLVNLIWYYSQSVKGIVFISVYVSDYQPIVVSTLVRLCLRLAIYWTACRDS